MKRAALILLICGIFHACNPSQPAREPIKPLLASRISIQRNIVYGSEDISKQAMDLYLQGSHTGEPNWFVLAEEPRPTVIHFHGGAWLDGDKTQEDMRILPYLEQGWHVVNVNYRLGENTAPKAVDDAMCALLWVSKNAENYRFDTDKIVLTGFSAGGHLALISGFLNHKSQSHSCFSGDNLNIQAVVNWFGISDIAALDTYFQFKLFPPEFNYPRRWIGNEDSLQSISELYSPINHITPDSPSTLTIHGTNDLVVPYNQSVALHKALEKAGVRNRLITLENRNHGGFSDEEGVYVFDQVFIFLDEQGVREFTPFLFP
jgi:acetyl esterase/lipase